MQDLTILTLNTWGAPYAKDIKGRMNAIVTEVTRLHPDIICLQEVFLSQYRQILLDGLHKTWQHAQYFPSGLLGSGLLTLSRYPITQSAFLSYRLSGKPERQQDYWVKKGIGFTLIKTPFGHVAVFNTHTHAQYEPQNDNEYAVFTNSNLYEAMRFVKTHGVPYPTILCGDMNTRPDQLGYQVLTQQNLIDAYTQQHPNDVGITFSADNPYAHEFNQRLDYMLIDRRVQCHDIQMVMNTPISLPDALIYSDHYGLLMRFTLQERSAQIPSKIPATVLQSLYAEVTREIALTHAQRTKHHEQLGFGVIALFDTLWITGRWMRQNAHAGSFVQAIMAILAFGYVVYHTLSAELNLRVRRNTLQMLADEIHTELNES